MEIRPFEAGDIDGAAVVAAVRYRGWRRFQPRLPVGYEDTDTCAAMLEEVVAAGAEGAVATDDRGIRGFLLAVPGDDVRGAHMWSALGCSGHAGDPEVLRRLYSELAGGWIAEGRGHHYVLSWRGPAGAGWRALGLGDRVADVWLSLGFGHEQVHGIRSTETEERSADGVNVRRAEPQDLDALAPLFPLIADAHRVAPTLAFIEQDFYDNLRSGHLELLEDPSVGYWLAASGDEVIGFATFRPFADDETSMTHPPGSVELTVAATVPEARGRGVMAALVSAGLRWAESEGFEVCVTDWRAANLDSSRAWPRVGFQPYAYRLHRIVDPRVLFSP